MNLAGAASETLRSNVVGHLGGVKSKEIRARQTALFAHVDAALGAAIAKGVGVKVTPLSFPSDLPTWDNTTTWVDTSKLLKQESSEVILRHNLKLFLRQRSRLVTPFKPINI